jgi:hypothetical protein
MHFGAEVTESSTNKQHHLSTASICCHLQPSHTLVETGPLNRTCNPKSNPIKKNETYLQISTGIIVSYQIGMKCMHKVWKKIMEVQRKTISYHIYLNIPNGYENCAQGIQTDQKGMKQVQMVWKQCIKVCICWGGRSRKRLLIDKHRNRSTENPF